MEKVPPSFFLLLFPWQGWVVENPDFKVVERYSIGKKVKDFNLYVCYMCVHVCVHMYV